MRAALLTLLLTLPCGASAFTANELYHALKNWFNSTDPSLPAPGKYFDQFVSSYSLIPGNDVVAMLGPMNHTIVNEADWRGLLVNLRTGDVIDTTHLPMLPALSHLSTQATGYPTCERWILNGWSQNGLPQPRIEESAYHLSMDRLEIGAFMGLQRDDVLQGCEFTDAPVLPGYTKGDIWRKIDAP